MIPQGTIYGHLDTMELLSDENLHKYVYVNTNNTSMLAQTNKQQKRTRKIVIILDQKTCKYFVISDTFNQYSGSDYNVTELVITLSHITDKTIIRINNVHNLFFEFAKNSNDFCCIHDDEEEVTQFVLNTTITIKKDESMLEDTKDENEFVTEFYNIFRLSKHGNTSYEQQLNKDLFLTFNDFYHTQSALTLDQCYNVMCYSELTIRSSGSLRNLAKERADGLIIKNDVQNAYATIVSKHDIPLYPKEAKSTGKIDFGFQILKVETKSNVKTKEFIKTRTKANKDVFKYHLSSYWNIREIDGYMYIPSEAVKPYLEHLEKCNALVSVEYCGGIEYAKSPKGLFNRFFESIVTKRNLCENETQKQRMKAKINGLYGVLSKHCIKVCHTNKGDKISCLKPYVFQFLMNWIKTCLALEMHEIVQKEETNALGVHVDCIYSFNPIDNPLFKRTNYAIKPLEKTNYKPYVDLSDEQLSIFKSIMTSTEKEIIVQAPAGTGKSELLRWILSEKVRLHGARSVNVMAYTGNALQLLHSKGLPIPKDRLYTLARGTEDTKWSIDKGFIHKGKINTKWKTKYIFIDEFSLMADVTYTYLLKHCDQLIMFGDYHQLSSIAGSNEKLREKAKCTPYILTENFRNSAKVQQIVIDSHQNKINTTILTKLPTDTINTQCIANTHRMCGKINKIYQSIVPKSKWKLRIQQNNYEIGVFTGQQFELEELETICAKHHKELYILEAGETPKDCTEYLKGEYDIDKMLNLLVAKQRVYVQIAFCITADSAQGGEWDYIIFCISTNDMRTKQTLYTVVSRAKIDCLLYITH